MGSRPSVRLRGSGQTLRLRMKAAQDPLATVQECCRAAIALDKALGEAIREAVEAGVTWPEVGRALTGAEGTDGHQVLARYTEARQELWRRLWGLAEGRRGED